MGYHHYEGPEPAEIAILFVTFGGLIGSFALLWVGRLLRDLRRGRQEEGLMRERLARWRLAAERGAAEPVAAANGATERDAGR